MVTGADGVAGLLTGCEASGCAVGAGAGVVAGCDAAAFCTGFDDGD
jgi:hypothetical protein